jgi:hypothetical protein
MEGHKVELEAQLAQFNSKIQIHKQKIADLPKSIEVAEKEVTGTIRGFRQLRTQLTRMQSS